MSEIAIEMIARLREEKKMLVDVIRAVEDWVHGEGYFITPTLKAKLAMTRLAVDNKGDAVALTDIRMERNTYKTRKTPVLSPEVRAARSERMKKVSAERWAKIREQNQQSI